jgi:hypothetical protein
MNSINNKFAKGFNNLFNLSILNVFILLSLIIIIMLMYFKYNKIELFEETDIFSTIINNYISKKQLNNEFQQALNERQTTIQTLANNIKNIFS